MYMARKVQVGPNEKLFLVPRKGDNRETHTGGKKKTVFSPSLYDHGHI
jgi:hypothetical protein